MASGCPVINTAIPHSCVAWVCPHGRAGLTVAVNDPVALAAASRQLLTESGLRDRLAAGGRLRAKAEFNQAQMARRSIEQYREVLDPGSRHSVGRPLFLSMTSEEAISA